MSPSRRRAAWRGARLGIPRPLPAPVVRSRCGRARCLAAGPPDPRRRAISRGGSPPRCAAWHPAPLARASWRGSVAIRPLARHAPHLPVGVPHLPVAARHPVGINSGLAVRSPCALRRFLARLQLRKLRTFLVEVVQRIATRYNAVARRIRAIAKGAANATPIQCLACQKVRRHVRIPEYHAPDTDPIRMPSAARAMGLRWIRI